MAKSKSKKPRAKTLKRLGVTFKNPDFLEAALTHPSYRNENKCSNLEDFDRMEFFGDSILNYVICCRLYQKFPDADEGLLSRLRSILVSRKVLLRIGKHLGLPKRMKLGRSLVDRPDISKSKLVSDCFESLIAAVYFDRGLKQAEDFIWHHVKPYFNAKKLFRLDPNPKSTLQELALKNWKRLPVYAHRPTRQGIQVTIALNTRKKVSAIGATRREAEEKAARTLIRKIRQDWLPLSKRRSSGKKLRKTR